MNATAFDSAVHALVLFCGVAGAHEATAAVPALNLQQLVALFLIAFGRAVLEYLDAHPLAELVDRGLSQSAAPVPGTGAPQTPKPDSIALAAPVPNGGHQSAATPIAEVTAKAALPSRYPDPV